MFNLMETLANRELGAYFEVPSFEVDRKTITEAIQRLAYSIQKSACLNGAVLKPETARVTVRPHWFKDRTTIAAKISIALSDDPARLLAFCVHKMHQATEDVESMRRRAEFAERRVNVMMEAVAKARNLNEVRRAIRKEEDR